LPEKFVALARVRTQAGGFHVTISKKEIADPLRLRKGQRLRVYLDKRRRRWTYAIED